MRHSTLLASLLVGVVTTAALAKGPDRNAQRARDIFKELIEIDTTQSNGDTAKAARAVAARLTKAGFPAADMQVFEVAPKRGNLVARLRGTGKKKPLMLLAHLDVVEARKEDWSMSPFQLIEKDGYFYGRGTLDDKFMVAAWVANLVRWKQDGYKPDRDLILVLETDEESSDAKTLGISWLLANHRELIAAEMALNEGGIVGVKEGKPLWNSVQTSEKTYQSYWLEVRNKGGHSSQPRRDNAIYQLAAALGRLASYEFPFELNETTRTWFETMSRIEKGQTAADMKAILTAKPDPAAITRLSAQPPFNSQMRTTCVATRLDAGHADNALPQRARAMVNCRILPGHTPEEVQKTLVQVIADPQVAITLDEKDTTSPPSPIPKDLVAAAKKVGAKFWPGIPVIPAMMEGATDGRFLRNAGIPCYGHSGLAADIFDIRAHGKDERISVAAFDQGTEYLYQLVKELAGGR